MIRWWPFLIPAWIKRTPEAALFEDDDPLRKAIEDAGKEKPAQWISGAMLGGVIILAKVFEPQAMQLLTAVVPGLPELVWFTLYMSVICGAYVCVCNAILRRSKLQFIRRRLLELGVPVCLRCGYCLRGQTDPRCPECGTPFDPTQIPPAGDQEVAGD